MRLERALAILVSDDGSVENRVCPSPRPAAIRAGGGRQLSQRPHSRPHLRDVRSEMGTRRRAVEAELDELTARLVEAGLASWAGLEGPRRQLIVRGQANLLGDLTALEDLERIRLCSTISKPRRTVIDLCRAPSRARRADLHRFGEQAVSPVPARR